MTVALLKLFLAPLLVVLTSLAARRWGPAASGVLVTTPVVAGPILLLTVLERGTDFGTRAAEASLLGLVALAVFAVVFAWAALRLTWWWTLLVAWATCLVTGLASAGTHLHPVAGLAVVVAAGVIGSRLMPSRLRAGDDGARAAPSAPPWWDLPARATATGALVVVVTTAAATLGPARTGVLAPFPIATSVVAAFVLVHQGPAAAVATLRGVLRGLGGFGVFCCAVALLLPRTSTWVAFAAALVAGMLVQAAVVVGLRNLPGGVKGAVRASAAPITR